MFFSSSDLVRYGMFDRARDVACAFFIPCIPLSPERFHHSIILDIHYFHLLFNLLSWITSKNMYLYLVVDFCLFV